MFNRTEREVAATSHDSLFNSYIVDDVFGSALFDNIKAVFPCNHKVRKRPATTVLLAMQ